MIIFVMPDETGFGKRLDQKADLLQAAEKICESRSESFYVELRWEWSHFDKFTREKNMTAYLIDAKKYRNRQIIERRLEGHQLQHSADIVIQIDPFPEVDSIWIAKNRFGLNNYHYLYKNEDGSRDIYSKEDFQLYITELKKWNKFIGKLREPEGVKP